MNRLYLSSKELMPFIKENISLGRKISITVTGNSMFPLFSHARDSVVIEKAIVYKPRDIVLYLRAEETLILHRIIAKKQEGYSMCGDNQDVEEYPVKESSILGRVCEFERKGKVISTDNKLYRLYSYIWCLALNHRKKILRLLMKIMKLKKRGR